MFGSNVAQMLKDADQEQKLARLKTLEEVLRMLQSPLTRAEIKADVMAQIEFLEDDR